MVCSAFVITASRISFFFSFTKIFSRFDCTTETLIIILLILPEFSWQCFQFYFHLFNGNCKLFLFHICCFESPFSALFCQGLFYFQFAKTPSYMSISCSVCCFYHRAFFQICNTHFIPSTSDTKLAPASGTSLVIPILLVVKLLTFSRVFFLWCLILCPIFSYFPFAFFISISDKKAQHFTQKPFHANYCLLTFCFLPYIQYCFSKSSPSWFASDSMTFSSLPSTIPSSLRVPVTVVWMHFDLVLPVT